MGRPRKNPDYDPDKIQKELIELTVQLYKKNYSYRNIAMELNLSVSKVIKLLITAGEYTSDICDQINRLYEAGKSIQEIQTELEVSRATVQAYLPYKKGIYNANKSSLNAERIKVFRDRQQVVTKLADDNSEDKLWDAVVVFQNYPFHTATGLPFVYELKKGRNGKYNKELIISRRIGSKTVVWSSVLFVFKKAIALQGELIERPKALGDIRGISYIYPILYRFGVIEVPEKIAKKMVLCRPLSKSKDSDNRGGNQEVAP